MNWLDAIERSKSKFKEAKRKVKNGDAVVWIYVSRTNNGKGYLLRQLREGRKVRLDYRFNKPPWEFDDWVPAVY